MILEILYVIGAVASIGCAIWAFFEAKSARKAAKGIQKYHTAIEKRIEATAINKIHDQTKLLLQKVSCVGYSSTEVSIKGLNQQDIAREVEEYARLLREHMNHFNDAKTKQKICKLCNELPTHIKGLAAATTFLDTKRYGSEIYRLIDSILPFTRATSQSLTLIEP